MPRIAKTIGSGMTKHGVIAYDWSEPGDVDGLVRAAIEAFERTSFTRLSTRLVKITTRMLMEAGLPSEPEPTYVVRPDGTWVILDQTTDLQAEQGSILLSFDQTILNGGYQPDSPEGYAAQVLRALSLAQRHLEAGNLDDAMALAFRAGELVNEADMKTAFEKDFLTGEKVRAGGRKGHRQTHGSQYEKDARHAGYLEAYDREIAGGAGKMEAYRAVAKKLKVSPGTVRRAVAKKMMQAD